jgi:hypothetical protein
MATSLGFYHTSYNRGGLITTVKVSEATGAVLDNITTAQATAGITSYACVCIKNTGTTNIARAGVYFASSAQNASIYMALGLTGRSSTTEQIIATDTTAPVGELIYVQPKFEYSALIIGALPVGAWYHIWLKRVAKVKASGEASAYFILTGTTS